MREEVLRRRLRLAGSLISLGVLVEIASLSWTHPLSLAVFVSIGGALIGGGILIFLYTLLF